MKLFLPLFFLTFFSFPLAAYITQNNHYGIQGGLQFTLGTPLNRIGLTLRGFHFRGGFQQNANLQYSWNFKSFGGRKGHETKVSLGVVAAYGKKDLSRFSYFLHELSNQTQYSNSVGLAYSFYLDQNSTSQLVGAIGLEFNKWQVATENDAFSFTGKDNYRTGAILVNYRDQKNLFSLSSELWTGNSKEKVKKIKNKTPLSRFGYKDLSQSHYGKTSHGLFTLAFTKATGLSQYVQIKAGIDSEYVRHVLQNKFIHDMPFLPEFLIPHKNLHVPMLDTTGDPFLYPNKQKVKRSKPVIQLSLNPALFY